MKPTISRIFHPIGQGAFYSERHKNRNVVYDCGYWRKSKNAEALVKSSFLHTDIIDILFISHYDFDHISQIHTLKKHTRNIDVVVLPLLHNEEKMKLVNLNSMLQTDTESLIFDPQNYFGDETRLIYVNSYEESETSIDNITTRTIGQIETGEHIDSGTPLKFDLATEWIYVPYNFKLDERKKKLEEKLKSAGFDIDKLKKTPDYSLNNLVERKTRKKLHSIYNSLSGNINENSMAVYSGPNVKQIYYYLRHIESMPPDQDVTREFLTGCLYTGDGDLNKTDFRKIFDKYWDDIGTIQIPHHGDLKCFNAGVLNDKNYKCPISYGSNNTYGHPSPFVIKDIIDHESIPILVNEKSSNIFIEDIYKVPN